MEKENKEITLLFSKNWIVKTIDMPSTNGETYRLCILEMPDDEGKEQKTKRTFTVYESRIETIDNSDYMRKTKLLKNGMYRVQRAEYSREERTRRILEQCEMTGQQIVDAFAGYRERREKNRTQVPDDQEGGKR